MLRPRLGKWQMHRHYHYLTSHIACVFKNFCKLYVLYMSGYTQW